MVKSAVLAFGFLILASGIAYPFVMTDTVDQMKAEIEIKNAADGTVEMTLWNPDYRNQISSSMRATVGPNTKVRIAGKEAGYLELARFNGKQALVSGEIAMYYQDHKKWEEWGFVNITPIPPEKIK